MEPQEKSTTEAAHNTMKSIILPGIRNTIIGIIVLGVVLCLVAGKFNYWQGWVFSILFAVLTNSQGIYLGIKSPELLARRMQIAAPKESRGQKIFLIVALLGFVGVLIFSALDQRFGWSKMPAFVTVVGDALMVLSFILYYFVLRENSWAATTIQTFDGQKVISTGPYARVRHPKYVGDMILGIGTLLALGSWWAFVFLVITIPALVWRILDEEKVLEKDLAGYKDYAERTRYRLLPGVW